MLNFDLMFLSISAKLTKNNDYVPHYSVLSTSIKKLPLLNYSQVHEGVLIKNIFHMNLYKTIKLSNMNQ